MQLLKFEEHAIAKNSGSSDQASRDAVAAQSVRKVLFAPKETLLRSLPQASR